MNYPLTPQGVADQLAAIYSLSSTDLTIQANAIKSDWRKWVIDHFSLSNAEKTCVNNISDRSATYFGDQCWIYFLNKGHISLEDYSAPPAPSGYGKFVESTSSTKYSISTSGDSTMTGELKFSVTYKPL